MRATRILVLSLGVALALSGAFADSKPGIEGNFDNAGPRQVEDTTQRAIVRDYSAAWQAIAAALANNNPAPLRQNFAGFALDQLAQRVKDQQSNGVKTRIIDHG